MFPPDSYLTYFCKRSRILPDCAYSILGNGCVRLAAFLPPAALSSAKSWGVDFLPTASLGESTFSIPVLFSGCKGEDSSFRPFFHIFAQDAQKSALFFVQLFCFPVFGPPFSHKAGAGPPAPCQSLTDKKQPDPFGVRLLFMLPVLRRAGTGTGVCPG